MAQNLDLRDQASATTTPATGVKTFYVNTSGVLVYRSSAGNVIEACAMRAGSLTLMNKTIATGGAPVTPGGAALPLISCYAGNSGTYMGAPTNWVLFTGPSGEKWATPAYLWT